MNIGYYWMKKVLIALMVLSLGVGVPLIRAQETSQTSTFSSSMRFPLAETEIQVDGDGFIDADIICGISECMAFDIELSFDPNLIVIEDVAVISFDSDTPNPTSVFVQGTVTTGGKAIFVLGAESVFSRVLPPRQGEIFTLSFRVLGIAEGTTVITIDEFIVYDPQNNDYNSNNQDDRRSEAEIIVGVPDTFVPTLAPTLVTGGGVPPIILTVPIPAPSPRLTPTPSPLVPVGSVTVSNDNSSANIRTGPSNNYPIVGYAFPENSFPVVAQYPLNSPTPWYVIVLPNGQTAWIASSVLEPNTLNIPPAGIIPPPPPRATPVPPADSAPSSPVAPSSSSGSGSSSGGSAAPPSTGSPTTPVPPSPSTCQDPDNDGACDNNGQDLCPGQYGPVRGCQDSDGDGTPNINDNCPFALGPASNNGCPVSPKAARGGTLSIIKPTAAGAAP
jgi:Bacterial SH3 domain/Cohesin domain